MESKLCCPATLGCGPVPGCGQPTREYTKWSAPSPSHCQACSSSLRSGTFDHFTTSVPPYPVLVSTLSGLNLLRACECSHSSVSSYVQLPCCIQKRVSLMSSAASGSYHLSTFFSVTSLSLGEKSVNYNYAKSVEDSRFLESSERYI